MQRTADGSGIAASPSRLTTNNAGILNFAPTLQPIDTHRVIAVLEKAVERLELLRMMNFESPTESVAFGTQQPANGTQGATTLGSKMFGSTAAATSTTAGGDQGRGVGAILSEQRRLESRYEELLQLTHVPRQNPLDPKLDPGCFGHVQDPKRKAHLEELQQISKQLKDQSKALCRQLKENPNDANNWKKVVTERDELIKLVMGCITELQNSSQAANVDTSATSHMTPQKGVTQASNGMATYETFARKVLDEQSAALWADALVRKEKETNQNVKQLQNEVRQERALKEQELEQCHSELSQLKAELRQLRKETKARADKIRAETDASNEAQERKASEDQRICNGAINGHIKATEVEQTVHKDVTEHLDAKLRALDDHNLRWNEHIEREQRALEESKHEVERRRQDYADKLKSMSEQLARAEESKASREEERQMIEQAKLDKEARAHARYCASTKLQAALKGMFTRQVLIGLKKKAAKKKK